MVDAYARLLLVVVLMIVVGCCVPLLVVVGCGCMYCWLAVVVVVCRWLVCS